MPKMFNHTVRIADLLPMERDAMFAILSLEFLGTRREDFEHDLEEKDVVALIRKETINGDIVGFSTLVTLDLPIAGRKVRAIFSGDTMVLPEWRGGGGIGIEVSRYFLKEMRCFSEYEICYILISKGWRTYKCLPLLFNRFSPKHDAVASVYDKQVMDAFGSMKYPGNYDSENGIITVSGEAQRLIPGSVDAVPPKEPDAHTEFFLKKNPTYLSGTELVCVAEVKEENFAPPLLQVLKIFN